MELTSNMKHLKRQSDANRSTLEKLECEAEQERQRVKMMESVARQERERREQLEREVQAHREEERKLWAQTASLQEQLLASERRISQESIMQQLTQQPGRHELPQPSQNEFT